MVSFSLDEESQIQTYDRQKQYFYFEDNANLYLSMLDNKDRTSKAIYTYNNSLDKKKTGESSNKHDDTYDANIRSRSKSTSHDDHRDRKETREIDFDELTDKVFEIYDKFKDMKKTNIEKMGKGTYIKNESKIINELIKKETQEKKILLKKLENLSFIYKDRHIKINEDDPLYRLKTKYDHEVERIYGESQIESNKEYIKYVFLAIEIVCNYLGFDMSGYTQFNMDRVGKYESILIEIGAIQPLVKLNTLNPVVKLGLLFAFNTLCFIGCKYAIKMDKSGGMIFNSISNVFGSFLSGPTPNSTNKQPQNFNQNNQPKMKGPR